PKVQKLMVGASRFLCVGCHRVSPPKLKIGKRSNDAIRHATAVGENLLKLSNRRPGIALQQIRLTANIGGIESVEHDWVSTSFEAFSDLQGFNRLLRILSI